MASIVKRGASYSVVYRHRTKENTKKQKWETYKTYAEALKRKEQIESMVHNSNYLKPIINVSELMEEYVQCYGTMKWSASTYSAYISTIRNYINPHLGNYRLSEVTSRLISQYYHRLISEPSIKHTEKKPFITIRTVREIHKILRSAFNQAELWGCIDRNPCKNAALPQLYAKERVIWTPEQIKAAIGGCHDELLALCIQLSFACSLRKGELLGLQWRNIDFSGARLHVDQELQRVQKQAMQVLLDKDIIFKFPDLLLNSRTSLVLKRPKTRTSIRDVYIPRSLLQQLALWKEKQSICKSETVEACSDYGLVFAQKNGRPINEKWLGEELSALAEKLSLPKVVFHSLRHSSTTYKLILTNGDIKSVQGDTGHAEAKMVLDVYGHIWNTKRQEIAQKIEQDFYKKGSIIPLE